MLKKINIFSSILLKLFILAALCVPAITSTTPVVIKNAAYYPNFILANFFVAVFLFLFVAGQVLDKKVYTRFIFFAMFLIVMLVGYIFFYQVNKYYISWEWQVRNISLSFLFFIILLVFDNRKFFERNRIIEFTLFIIISTNLISILFYLKGFLGIRIYNWKLIIDKIDPSYYERRFNWIYFHKSQFALMLLLFILFTMVHKNKFYNNSLFIVSLAILYIALYLSHVNTSILGGAIIMVSFLADFVIKKYKKNRKNLWILMLPVVGVAFFLFKRISMERNIVTLGSRVPIWKASLSEILGNLNGIGNQFMVKKIIVSPNFAVWNCHNIFLNEIFRFSVPVGVCFTMFVVGIFVFSIIKKFSFLRVGGCLAILLAMSMDYCILPSELSMVMFMLYCIYIYPIENKPKHIRRVIKNER